VFNVAGECNYCKLHDTLDRDFPNNEQGEQFLKDLIVTIKNKGRHREYDVVVGVSGGTDSTYLLHLSKELGLRPLAVHLDNGWNSEISVSNLKNSLEALDIDLITHVINWEEMKDILVSFLKAGLPWADAPTDIAIIAILYKIAAKYNVKYIFVGNNFRTEGKQPTEWTYADGKQIRYIQHTFGTQKLKTFPNQTLYELMYYGFVKGVKMVRPFYYIKYDKAEAKKFLSKTYGWVDYGGHHHESLYTKFVIAYWLTKKFGIDKRKVTFSALVRSGEMTREEALQKLSEPPYDPSQMEEDKEYVIKKLGLTEKEFIQIWNTPNKKFTDYPSYYPLYLKIKDTTKFVFKYILPFKPMVLYELEKNDQS
jgi:N-acetyl sugar amidotransferase